MLEEPATGGEKIASESKRREVLQLLKDYRSYHSPYGGATPIEDTALKNSSYGPNGMIFAGQDFEEKDRRGLAESYRALNAALRILRRDGFKLWASLVEPYLADPADPALVDHWRALVGRLDADNARIRRRNDAARKAARRAGKKPPEPVRERLGLVWTRRQLERHDRAIATLVEYLRDVDLYVHSPRLMSEEEEASVERQNAEIYAVFQRLRVSGLGETAAIEQTAENFGILPATVERIIEFRSDLKLATCAEEGCEGEVFSQNMCSKHYQRNLKRRKKARKSA